MFSLTPISGVAYLAVEGFEHLLVKELGALPYKRYERLFVLKEKPAYPVYWCDNIWEELYLIDFSSISTAAKALKSLQRNWYPYHWQLFRRASLVQEALPRNSWRELSFPPPELKTTTLGSWTLLSENQLLASPRCRSPRPNGLWQFAEDRVGPPSRAYLKLWEALARCGRYPLAGERCLDLGASPGGWTWVLNSLGAEVVAFDRSPLREDLMQAPGVTFVKGDAFAVSAAQLNEATWLFCDVICYPEKLYEFVVNKLLPSSISYAVCTLKFQGDEYPRETVDKFAALPKSHMVHLSANKHELTWMYGLGC
jgi:23S rRNA (cytidine2498-2'-O)-methyltransferase